MQNTVLIIGATGLIGSAYLDLIKDHDYYEKIIVLSRRHIPEFTTNHRIEQHIIDFNEIEQHADIIRAHTVVSTFGATMKKAGTKENYFKIDHEYPLQAATHAFRNGAKHLIIVSSVGADPDSVNFYIRVKGQLEESIKKIAFESIHILRPSLLMGDRKEFRFREQTAILLARPFTRLFPPKYRPIHAQILARKIHSLIKQPDKGIHIHEGEKLHTI